MNSDVEIEHTLRGCYLTPSLFANRQIDVDWYWQFRLAREWVLDPLEGIEPAEPEFNEEEWSWNSW